MFSRIALTAALLAGTVASVRAESSVFAPTYQSLYSDRMTAEPVADEAGTTLVRRDGYAVMSEELARAETARASSAETESAPSAAAAGGCCCDHG